MAFWRPGVCVPSETPVYASHEVQRPSNAQGLGQQQALSVHVQRGCFGRLPCAGYCYGHVGRAFFPHFNLQY